MSSATGRSRAFLLGFVLLCAMTGCGARPSGERAVVRSFYFWRGMFTLGEREIAALRELEIRRLYLRLFDVALDKRTGAARPIGVTSIGMPAPEGIAIVPTIFITLDVIRALDSAAMPELAGRIVSTVERMLPELGSRPVEEIQIDCDWTATTRRSYFALLDAISRRVEPKGWIVSSTIRLHQLRDRHASGIPPVERGMLMVYNTGNPADPAAQETIFDTDDIRGYLKSLGDYPLHLDVALPLFSWGSVFHEGAFFVLLNNLRAADLRRPGIDSLGEGWYRLAHDLYLDGHHLFAGDRIRLEEVDPKEVLSIAGLISSRLDQDSAGVSLYHLHPSILESHDRKDLSALYGALH